LPHVTPLVRLLRQRRPPFPLLPGWSSPVCRASGAAWWPMAVC